MKRTVLGWRDIALAGAACASLAVLAATGGPAPDGAVPSGNSTGVIQRVPCPAEDSGRYCYWDAQSRGNLTGWSFTRDGNGDLDWCPVLAVVMLCDHFGVTPGDGPFTVAVTP